MNLKLAFTPAALDANGLASAVADTATVFTLAATTMADSLAHIVTIGGLAATDHSGKTFTVVGTDSDGIAQTEGILGPNGVATVSTTKHFLTVTSVTVSTTTGADTFNIGWSAVAISKSVLLNWRQQSVLVSLGVIITGTISVTVQHTLDEYTSTAQPSTFDWLNHTSIATATASEDGNYAFPVVATRLLVNSVTAGGTCDFSVVQAGN